jgi:hypothetical protein
MKDSFKRRVAKLFALFGFVPKEELSISRDESRALAEQAIKLIDRLLASDLSNDQRKALEAQRFEYVRVSTPKNLPLFAFV